MTPTHTYGGGRDQTAIVGHAPESRDWQPDAISYPPYVAGSARLEAYVTVDAGTKQPTHIGPRVWLMKGVHIGHDAVIEPDVEIAPHAVVCGHAIIRKDAKIGVNASILPYVKVGDGARIGAGAVVTKDVPAGETWAGNPARKLEKREPSEFIPSNRCPTPKACTRQLCDGSCF